MYKERETYLTHSADTNRKHRCNLRKHSFSSSLYFEILSAPVPCVFIPSAYKSVFSQLITLQEVINVLSCNVN
jgi:hypothetical protein